MFVEGCQKLGFRCAVYTYAMYIHMIWLYVSPHRWFIPSNKICSYSPYELMDTKPAGFGSLHLSWSQFSNDLSGFRLLVLTLGLHNPPRKPSLSREMGWNGSSVANHLGILTNEVQLVDRLSCFLFGWSLFWQVLSLAVRFRECRNRSNWVFESTLW